MMDDDKKVWESANNRVVSSNFHFKGLQQQLMENLNSSTSKGPHSLQGDGLDVMEIHV